MDTTYDTYMVTCDKCFHEWDGQAQCPCGLDVSLSSSEDLFPSISDEEELKYFVNPLLDKNEINKDKYFKKWKEFILIKCCEKRYDILDDKFYTKKEMNEFYGDNYMWNQQSPKMLYIKRDLLNLLQNCENISDEKIKLLINVLFKEIY